ncbi:Bifunctional protein RIB2 [Zancudomyces culisetae]|uniref:Bifunctional protein RIB2 n=2 Tax=Zancudomyces culisetae TaxID=1213189 RepID=A0A1R1PVS2_ZANCU|nr:Bifunctional protein RIB2 [Zancudomyces culisetae]|eukprot:OMH85066.1 Bifunctional protein RIB2 [Zancudomyces culisetae]
MTQRGTYTVVVDCDGNGEYERAVEYMKLAIQQAWLAGTVTTAFNVGSVIVVDEVVQATGYSREIRGNTHAAECAIKKLDDIQMAKGAVLYNTMEPCSFRLSGNKSCTERIIEAGIAKVFIGVKEPDTFSNCQGVQILLDHGIDVVCLKMLEEDCLEPNAELLLS